MGSGLVRVDAATTRSVALVWSGTKESAVDITPPEALDAAAIGIYGNEIVGAVHTRGWSWNAAMWRNGEYIRLEPANDYMTGSAAVAACEGVQVGYFTTGMGSNACMWLGTPESMIFIEGGGGAYATANGVWRDGSTVYIVGTMETRHSPWPYHAMLWIYTLPRTSDFNGDGFLDFFDYDAFGACFEGAGCPAGRTADFNGDDFVDFADYGDFVAAFESGT